LLVVMSGLPRSWSDLMPDIIVNFVGAWIIGFVAVVVPGGLGVREGVFALTLAPIIGPTMGVFVPLLARLMGMLAEAIFAVLCYVLPQP